MRQYRRSSRITAARAEPRDAQIVRHKLRRGPDRRPGSRLRENLLH
jgi:hypothetical protein